MQYMYQQMGIVGREEEGRGWEGEGGRESEGENCDCVCWDDLLLGQTDCSQSQDI